MKHYPHQQQRAVSLLELLLVLAIASVLIFIGIYRYQTQQRLNELAALKQNINYISHAANEYYRVNCHTNDQHDFSMTLADLKQAGYLPQLAKSKLLIPWQDGSDYYITVTYIGKTQDSNQDIYQFSIHSQLDVDASLLDWYLNKLDASYAKSPRALIWNRIPSHVAPTIDPALWIMNAGAGYNKKLFTDYSNTQTSIPCGY